MQKDLVSIITPSYNTGHLIHRLLDSVLMQDYPYVEMYIVDDGSTDNISEVISNYRNKFSDKGYSLYFSTQPNSGQAAAVNSVLQKVNGEFLTWPDSDDFYISNEAISTFVKSFRQIDEDYGLVRSQPTFLDEETMTPLKPYTTLTNDNNQFENCLFNKNFIWPPISYMIRQELLRCVNPDMQIYSAHHGAQNWQMLLPLLYTYHCYTIKQHIAGVLERRTSFSRGTFKTYEQQVNYFNGFEESIDYTLDTIKEMPEDKRLEYKMLIHNKYLLEKFNISMGFFQIDKAKLYREEIKKRSIPLSFKEKLKYYLIHYPLVYRIIRKIVA